MELPAKFILMKRESPGNISLTLFRNAVPRFAWCFNHHQLHFLKVQESKAVNE
jgi:hypothetical protein